MSSFDIAGVMEQLIESLVLGGLRKEKIDRARRQGIAYECLWCFKDGRKTVNGRECDKGSCQEGSSGVPVPTLWICCPKEGDVINPCSEQHQTCSACSKVQDSRLSALLMGESKSTCIGY